LTAADEAVKREQSSKQVTEKSLQETKHEMSGLRTERDKALRQLADRESEVEARLRDISRLQEELKQTKEKMALQRKLSQSPENLKAEVRLE